MNTMLKWTIAGVLTLGGIAGCSSDKAAAPAATETKSAGTAATPAGENAAVTEFCKQADDLAAKLKGVMADPTSGNVAEITASATKLTTEAAALISSTPADSAKITACAQKLTDAATGG